MRREMLRYRAHRMLSTDHPRLKAAELVRPMLAKRLFARDLLLIDARDRRDATAAATGDVLHVSNAGRSIPERLAQNGDLEPEIALVHGERRPGTGDQIVLADHITSALYQKP